MVARLAVSAAIVASLIAFLYGPLVQRLTVVGVFRRHDEGIRSIHGEDLRVIDGTVQCEDLHHHKPSNLLFAACQIDRLPKYSWFPPLGNFKNHNALDPGALVVIDPQTFKASHLKLNGFSGPFITHGIDIYSDKAADTIYIFAINHLPNPQHYEPKNGETPSLEKARSQIEVFRHKLGTAEAEFVRTIRHPLIRTPNDIYATSPTSFYVTNDHRYRDGFMRQLEDLVNPGIAPKTDTVHVEITDSKSKDPEGGLKVTIALQGLHNNNGLGHASSHRPEEVAIVDAAGGVLTRARRDISGRTTALEIIEHLQVDSTIDNPTYYEDAYATAQTNASGYVLAGLARALELASVDSQPDAPIPVMVWHVRPHGQSTDRLSTWEKRLIFQDDGKVVKAAATAVMVGIDPKENAGKKQAWLFVTGFLSDAVVASKVDL